MFSEYASRFLAQSQSRLSLPNQPDEEAEGSSSRPSRPSRPSRKQRDTGRGHASSRSFLSRGNGGSPYQQTGVGSRFGHLGFASPISAAQDAPLFHSTFDEYRDHEDDDERERERADLLALQRSRRMAAASRLAESAESAGSTASVGKSAEQERGPYTSKGEARDTTSRWVPAFKSRDKHEATVTDPDSRDEPRTPSDAKGKGKMVDIGLESQYDADQDPPESLLGDMAPHDDDEDDEQDSSPLPFQKLKAQPERDPFLPKRSIIEEMEQDSRDGIGPDMMMESGQEDPVELEGELFRHDPFFAWIFLICQAGMVSTFVLVWLHTSPGKSPVGDTIYATLQTSFDMLAIDTVVAVFVSLVWLAALRSFARPLVTVILVAVPVVMLSFSLYAFISSFQGRTHGNSFQDSLMRWASLIPAACCIAWLWLVARGRRAIQQAVEILQFSSKILAQNSGLLLIGFGCLAFIVVWTWIWLAMFTRVFMGGYFSKSLVRFVISMSSWWLGAAFILMYLWTLGVVNAVHRATTAATVSQWYFHRNAGPVTPSREVVGAAISHATTTIFGSVCESTLLSLLLRAPLLFLPRNVGVALSNVAAVWIPTPIIALTNPLTVTYAAIHSQSLSNSARGLVQLEVVSPAIPTTTLTPRALEATRGQANGLLPYRLAKLLLVATRCIMATGLGFAGWVMTAKQMQIQLPDGLGLRGSAYAYVVGIMASFIGYSVMGAMEGILSGIVDAVLICYGSERRMERGHGRFCLEAAYLFGERHVGHEGYA